MSLQYWICPSCDTSVHEKYISCGCGYRTTRAEIESNKIPLQDVIKRADERRKNEGKDNNICVTTIGNAQASNHVSCPHCEELIPKSAAICPVCAEPIGGKGVVSLAPLSSSSSAAQSMSEGAKTTTPTYPGNDVKMKIKMSRLNDLFADGLITQKEYDDKKQQLLDEYLDA